MTDATETAAGVGHAVTRLRAAAFACAALAVAIMMLDDRVGWFEYQPGGTAFFTYVRPVFYGLLVVGAALAWRWELAGALVAGFAAGSIGAFVVNQLVGRHAIVVVALLAVPAVLWAVSDLIGRSGGIVLAGVAAAAVAVLVGVIVGEAIYDRSFGPTHPESDRVVLPASPVRWIWSGGVSATEAEVRVRTERDDVMTLRLAVSLDDGFSDPSYFPASVRDGSRATFAVDSLRPATRYHYAVEIDGRLDLVRSGTFTTFPDGPSSFRFTVGSCARVGSNGRVYDAILEEQPLFHVIAGDFHYGDIPDDDRERYDEVIDLTLRRPAQAALYRSTPIAYVWDDHDYGVNDADSFSPSRLAAMRGYRANVPHYELADEVSPIYQSFDVGRVRFLLTDARSAREPGVSMLGSEQLEWFLDAVVRASEEQALVVWVNPVPWVADEAEGADHWGGYADERGRIADVIAAHSIDHLLMVSGDAHMVAIDDGTNTDFSTVGGAGFPLIHAAALDRPGSTKGGPYSEGAIGGSGQYAVIDVVDEGDAIEVSLRAKRYDGETLLSYEFAVPGP